MPTVLFVCGENSFRSILAEALFNAHPPPGWRAASAGVLAEGKEINPVVHVLLGEIGLRVAKSRPDQVTPAIVRAAAWVVTFGCLDRCPAGAAGKTEDWPVPASTGRSDAQLREIRDDLRRRVQDLAVRLQNRKDS